ncbi:MAG: hypothetical protein GY946_17920 [bacterium]|nr:hypothetical protein [bacterium]
MEGQQTVQSATESTTKQFVSFRVHTRCYAVPIETVVEMTLLQNPEPIAGAPSWICGMMRLRDSVVPILDLRKRLGMGDLKQEVTEIATELQQRKNDHVVWLQTLEESCASGARFELQKDPTQCAFGRWFYAFDTEDETLGNQIAKFEEPHNQIHALADLCLGLATDGKQDEAQEIIDNARETELRDMIDLFDHTTREMVDRSRQMVIILQGEAENLGLAVDRIDSVATIEDTHIDPRPLHELERTGSVDDMLVSHVVLSTEDDGIIQVLDVDRLFSTAGIGSQPVVEDAETAA